MAPSELPPLGPDPEDFPDTGDGANPQGIAVDELLAGHALGDLDEAEQALLRQHLAADPALRQRLDELTTTLQLLPLALPDQPMPPARLRERLLAPTTATTRGSGTPADPAQGPGRNLGQRGWGPLVMAALAAGLALTTVQVHELRQQLAGRSGPQPPDAGWQPGGTPSPRQALPVSRTIPMQGMTADGPVSGQVVVQAGQGYNLLKLKGLPAPPPEHVYRLWALVDGREVGCVQFVPDDMGVVSMPIPTEPSSHAQTVSISLEPLRPGGDRPLGPRVVTSL